LFSEQTRHFLFTSLKRFLRNSSSKAFFFISLHKAVLLLELKILLVESVDSINHGLDKLNLRVAKTVLVGDIVGDASLATGLSTGSTGLQGKGLATLLQGVDSLLGPAGQVDVHRGAHASSQVGGARVQVSVLGVEHELLARLGLNRVSDGVDSTSKTLKDSLDIPTLLHGDDPKLILLVDPDQEALGLIVEDSTALGPLPLHAGGDQVLVSGDKKEVVINQLLANGLLHALEGVVVSLQVSAQLGESGLHQSLNSKPLLLGDSGGKTKAVDATAHTNTGGLDRGIGVDVSLDLGDIHVGSMLEVSLESMVLKDDGLEDSLEVLVGVSISGVDSAVLVIEVDSASNGLGQSESRGLGGDASQLGPLVSGDMLGHQGVGGLDVGERSGLMRCLSSGLHLVDDPEGDDSSDGELGHVGTALEGHRVELHAEAGTVNRGSKVFKRRSEVK